MLYGGWISTALPVLVLLMSATMKLTHNPDMVKQFVEKFGYTESLATPLGIVEVLCAVLYCIPATAVLGAILLTGYLGGAVATHARVGDPPIAPIVVGVLVWLGLFLRDARLRELLPLRK